MLIDDVSRDLYEKVRAARRDQRTIQREDLAIYMTRDFAKECLGEIHGAVSTTALYFYNKGEVDGVRVFLVDQPQWVTEFDFKHPPYVMVNLKECK